MKKDEYIAYLDYKIEQVNLELSKINAKLDQIMTFNNMNELKMTAMYPENDPED